MYLVDLSRIVSESKSQEDVLEETRGIWQSLYDRMEPTETLWVIAPNEYRDGRLWPISMAVADFARELSDLVLKNIITVHRWGEWGGDMASAYEEILFFVKDKREYQYHKDEIRIAHVYEGNEWGGDRKKDNSAYHDTEVRRYNPNGKDPGNVWVNEDRTLTDSQEIDTVEPLPVEEAIRRCVLVGSAESEVIYTLWMDEIEEILVDEKRETKHLDPREIREGGTT